MALSWHSDDYRNMVEEIEDYICDLGTIDSKALHEIVNHLVNIMIDHGAVDPT